VIRFAFTGRKSLAVTQSHCFTTASRLLHDCCSRHRVEEEHNGGPASPALTSAAGLRSLVKEPLACTKCWTSGGGSRKLRESSLESAGCRRISI